MRNSSWKNGLPPVGEVCEFIDALGDWSEVRITGYGEKLALFIPSGGKAENCTEIDARKFRPLKSEAERKRYAAVEEMIKACRYEVKPQNQHYYITFPASITQKSAEKLYDAGYRKVNPLTDEQIVDITNATFPTSSARVSWMNGARWARSQIMGEES